MIDLLMINSTGAQTYRAPMSRRQQKLQGIDLSKEVRLIEQKKSKLSASMRKLVMEEWNEQS